MSVVNVVGVQFRRAGKIYDFQSKDLLLSVGDSVVVETERGPSLAEVIRVGLFDPEGRDLDQLKPVLRVATNNDLDDSRRLTPEKAESFCKDKVKKLELDMRVIKAEVQFGGGKVIIYFSAPGRVDFRELVKELASGLKSRVELKQVGARDEAKLTGGLGICGREFCCSSFLREFVPVSIKMAKNQNLALNPSKVSGGCGRLLCCLTYEDETYSALRQKLLPKRTRVQLPDGTLGDVIKGDILNQVMLVETDTGEQVTVPVNDLTVVDGGAGVTDDWGDDLDLEALMDEPGLADDDPEETKRSLDDDVPQKGAQAKGNEFRGAPRGRPKDEQPRRRQGRDDGKRANKGDASLSASEGEGAPKKRSRNRRNRKRRRGGGPNKGGPDNNSDS